MTLKNMVRLEHSIEGKTGHFFCENDTPLEAVKDMLFHFMKYIGQIEDNVKAAQKAAEEEAAKSMPNPEVSPEAPIPKE